MTSPTAVQGTLTARVISQSLDIIEVGLKLVFPARPQSPSRPTVESQERTQSSEASTVSSLGTTAAPKNELTNADWQGIQKIEANATKDLAALHKQRQALSQLRQQAHDSPRQSWLQRLLGGAETIATDLVFSRAATSIKSFFSQQIQPLIDKVYEQYAGKTFSVTEGQKLPDILTYASLPKNKVGKVFSFNFLKDQLKGLSGKASPRVYTNGELEEDRVVITRKNKTGEESKLEFEYRRPGVVNVYLNGKRLQAQGKNVSLFTDDALKLAQEFANGKTSLSMRKADSNERVIGHSSMYKEAEQKFKETALSERRRQHTRA